MPRIKSGLSLRNASAAADRPGEGVQPNAGAYCGKAARMDNHRRIVDGRGRALCGRSDSGSKQRFPRTVRTTGDGRAAADIGPGGLVPSE